MAFSTDGGHTWSSLSSQGGGLWSGSVALPIQNPVDAHTGTSANVVIGGFDRFQGAPTAGTEGWTSPPPPTQQPVPITAIDTTAPTVDWRTPPDKSVVEIAAGATPVAQATIAALISDDLSGVASAGPVSQVEYRVDGGSWAPVGHVTTADPALWQGTVTLEGLGSHTIDLTCSDSTAPPTRQRSAG